MNDLILNEMSLTIAGLSSNRFELVVLCFFNVLYVNILFLL